jgi:hypothetical protein
MVMTLKLQDKKKKGGDMKDTFLLPVIELIRLEEHHDFGTFGILKVNKTVFCVTLEPPDKENVQNISSIPAQQYICYRHNSPTFGDTFKIMGVPDRSEVLFHAGNIVKHTKGCIILAQYFGKLKGNRAVLNSGNTFKQFMHVMRDFKFFHLTIKEVY